MRAISSIAPALPSMLAAAQLGCQQVLAAEDVERQVAVAIVIAVKEPAFLMAVQRVVGGIEIEDDLLRWLADALRGTDRQRAARSLPPS